ncbi:hypothetical protein G3N61_38965, partial [Burkholderia sp. Ac-20349]|nr:hypothetical protein [Burkholderia sp. Ac-20349]
MLRWLIAVLFLANMLAFVVLTAAGEELRVRAEEILSKASALKEHIRNAVDGTSGTLHIG